MTLQNSHDTHLPTRYDPYMNSNNTLPRNGNGIEYEQDGDNTCPNELGNGIIDGGIAGENLSGQSMSCSMLLLIEFSEYIQSHPIYSRGVTVSIGLNKNTKLAQVFAQYCRFANSYSDSISKSNYLSKCTIKVEPSELEFFHCNLLDPSDTAETSALMKNDRLFARRVRAHQRKIYAERIRLQRESDRDYFEQMRHLLPDLNPSSLKYDIIFECCGRVTDQNGLRQEVLTTSVKGHSSILRKRCKWLDRKFIMTGKNFFSENIKFRNERSHEITEKSNIIITIPDNDGEENFDFHNSQLKNNGNNCEENNLISSNLGSFIRLIQDGDKNITTNIVREVSNNLYNRCHANEVEDEDSVHSFSLPFVSNHSGNRNKHEESKLIFLPETSSLNILSIPLMHPPEAVKILLEYCYTNRVISLGQEAFMKSSKLPDPHLSDRSLRHLMGPICPFLRSPWPNKGLPTISFSVALAGIQLAEEVNMPRLSLMCEIAASQLVSNPYVLEALALCQFQFEQTGNHLPILRKAVMLQHVLGHGKSGVVELSDLPSFNRMLADRKELIIPSLMNGTLEVIVELLGTTDRNALCNRKSISHALRVQNDMFNYFDEIDYDDISHRSKERQKWREERSRKRKRSIVVDANLQSVDIVEER